jgi:nucleoid-associated protein YgaU
MTGWHDDDSDSATSKFSSVTGGRSLVLKSGTKREKPTRALKNLGSTAPTTPRRNAAAISASPFIPIAFLMPRREARRSALSLEYVAILAGRPFFPRHISEGEDVLVYPFVDYN